MSVAMVERDDRITLRQYEHDAVVDDRIEGEGSHSGGIGPGHFKLLDVRLVDLLERGVLRRIAAAQILVPGSEIVGDQRMRVDQIDEVIAGGKHMSPSAEVLFKTFNRAHVSCLIPSP